MHDFQRKRKSRNTYSSHILLVFLVVLIVFIGNATFNMYFKYSEAKEKKDNAERELYELQTRERDIQESLNRLATPLGIEEEFRTRYGVSLEGERVIVVLDDSAELPLSPQRGAIRGFFEKVKDWFHR